MSDRGQRGTAVADAATDDWRNETEAMQRKTRSAKGETAMEQGRKEARDGGAGARKREREVFFLLSPLFVFSDGLFRYYFPAVLSSSTHRWFLFSNLGSGPLTNPAPAFL